MSSWQKFKESFISKESSSQNSNQSSSSWQKYKSIAIKKREDDDREKMLQNRIREAERDQQERQAKRDEQDVIVRKIQEEREQKLKEQEEAKAQEIAQKKQQYAEQLAEIQKNISTSPTEQAKNKLSPTDKIKLYHSTLSEEDKKIKSSDSLGNLKKVGKVVKASKDIESEDLSKKIPALIRYGIDRGKQGIKNVPGDIWDSIVVNTASDHRKYTGEGSFGDKLAKLIYNDEDYEKYVKENNARLDEIDKHVEEYAKEKNADNNAEQLYQQTLTPEARTIGSTGEQVGRMLPIVGLSAINPYLGDMAMMTSSSGQESVQLLDEGVELPKARTVGNLKGLAEVSFDKLIGGVKFRGGTLDDIVGNVIANKTKTKVSNFLLTKGYQIGGEIVEENLTNLAGYGIDKLIIDKDTNLGEMWADAKETSKTTFLTTLTLNLMGLGGSNYSTNTTVNQQLINEYENITNTKLNKQQKENLLGKVDQIKQELENNSEVQEQGMTQEQNMAPMETATNEGSYTKQQELLNKIENNQETLYNNNESESGINETILEGRTRGNGRIEGEVADQAGQTSNTGISTENVSQNFKENRQISYEEFIDYANKNTIQQDTDEVINIKQKAKELGLNPILFNGDGTKDYYGMTDKSNPNNIYIDINQKEIRGEDILYHEFLHSRKRNNDSIYVDKISPIEQDLAENYSDVINNFIDEKGLDERYKKYPELISEEIIADYTSKHLGSLEIDYDLPLIYEETINQAVDEMIKNVRNSNAQSQNAAPSMENNVQKYNKYKQNIIKSKETQVNNLINFKNETSRNIDQKIAEKEALLNSKKNQNTKTSSILKSQIENLKAQKQSIENLYNEKIDKTNSKISKEKIEFETRNRMKKEAREVIRAEIAPLTEDLTKYKDKKAGLLFNRETAQRNIDDIVSDKELANSVKEIVFNPVQKDQANKTREINTIFERINSLGLDKKQKYYYVPKESKTGLKVDEATLAQLLIEKKITDKDLLKYDIDSKGIEKIHNTADTFKEILDDLYVRMNEQQLKYGYSPIGKIENYFPHFTEDKADTMLGKIASYFNIDLSNQSLPTDIAGLTDTFKPGETWNANIQKRRTEKTDYDALTAMERYVLGATEIIHITEDIQRIREYAKQIRYKYSDKAIQEEVDKIINNNELTQEAKDSALEGIFKNVENGLPNFVTWLDDYANTLAGKKAFADRNMERNIGRNMYKSMSGIESRIASNTIGGNISVSLTNFAPLFQAMGTTKVNYLLTGMLQTTKNNITVIFDGGKDTSFANNSTFLTNRFGTDSISRKTFSQKFSDKASALMNMIDEFTAESIVRGKYLENLDSGMTEEQALKSADEYAGKIMADRSKGALPLIFNTKNPLSKLMTMFQVEPNNIVSNYFKDMPRDAKSDAQFTKQITKLMVASYAFNSLVMAIRGGNEVLPDPIRWVSYLIQMVTGDDDEKEKAKDDLIESLVGSTPFISNLAGFIGMEDIGRVPISNAMPDLTKISSLFDPEVDSKYKKETALKEFSKPFLYLGLPTGGAQLKKAVEGIATVSAGGSYKTNKKGETQLQFPVENANVLDYAKAGIFGKYSLSDSKAYADRGYKALSGKQTKTYQESGIPFKEYTEYIDSKLKKNEDKINYINNTKWNTDRKWGIYKNDILSDNERKDGGSQVSDAEYIVKNGTSKLDYINSYNKLQKNNLDIPTKEEYIKMKEKGVSLKGYTDYKTKVKQETESKRKSGELTQEQELKDKDKLEILINSNYSQKETQGIYESYILRSTDKKYDIVKTSFATGNKLNINKYLQYKLAEANGEFDADRKDDGTENGKAVYGSSKKKRWTYIENMDITYTQKLILYGLECTPTNSEQTQIVNYINSLPNKTQKEKLEILDQFEGFTIYKNGTFKY